MRSPVRCLLVVSVATLGIAATGCGSSEGGTACSGDVCTVRTDGPGVYTLDQQGTEVELSELTADSVRVRINSEQQTISRDAAPARIRGFLVTAPETSAGGAKVRIQR